MAAKEKKRTVTYHRADFPDNHDSGLTLQVALERCLNQLPNIDDTQVDLREGNAAALHRLVSGNKICLHVVAWTRGETISTVPHAASTDQADLSSLPPGADWDYLDGDGMLLVSENHVLVLPSGVTAKQMENYTRKIVAKSRECGAVLSDDVENFQLLPIVNQQAVRDIHHQGIKKVHLHLGQYLETGRMHDDASKSTILKNIGRDILSSLIFKDEDRKQIEEAENVSAQLIISVDGRRHRRGLTYEKFSEMVSPSVAESPDDVEFETKSGQRVRRGSLILSKPVNIRAFDKTVSHADAWDEMSRYFLEIQDAGFLEL